MPVEGPREQNIKPILLLLCTCACVEVSSSTRLGKLRELCLRISHGHPECQATLEIMVKPS